MKCLLVLIVPCLALTYFPSKALAVPLVVDGQPRAVLILPEEPEPDETLAAEELQNHVKEMSGAELEILVGGKANAKQAAVRIGRAAPQGLENEIRKVGDEPDAFALVVEPGGIQLRGLSSEGTLFAAYELLEQLGVRWFMPGRLGTVVPNRMTVELNEQRTIQTPSFVGRWHGGSRDRQWARRMRMGGPHFPAAHGIPIGRDVKIEENPEYFALIGGRRVKRQLCVSNSDVVRLAVENLKAYFKSRPEAPWIGMGPNDGGGFCECDECRALDAGDWDPFSNDTSVTDRYVWFFNQVLDGIADEYPDKKICFYAYHSYMRPPLKTKPDPRIVPALAPIALCRVHGPTNPVCPEKSYYRWLVEEWGKVLPEVYDRGYWFNLADPGMPFIMVSRMREQIPLGHKLGIKGWRVETLNQWASENPSLYVAAKLMWNHKTDADALMADFAGKYYGPAAEPMARYTEMMDHALRDADFHTGCSFDMPHFYPQSLRDEARGLLDRAAQAAGEGIYSERIAVTRQAFDYLEAFIAMLETRAKHDYVASQAALEQVDAIRETLLAYDPPMLYPRTAAAYLRRFFRLGTEQGNARVTGGNQLVAGLADEWQFQIDPSRVGEDLGWWRPEHTGGNWQTLRTSSLSWSDQGLRYYKGEAWYRQTVEIPEKFVGKRVFLWFGGVDEKAKVWVNGTLLGISHGGTFVPFEFDATDAVQSGKNTVAVRMINERVNELGTGGITAPAMFYAPAKGKDAELENVRPLGETFP